MKGEEEMKGRDEEKGKERGGEWKRGHGSRIR